VESRLSENEEKLERTAASLQRLFTAEHPSEATFSAYVDGTLDALEREAVEEHLAGCPICREDAADLQTMRASLTTPRKRGSDRSRWLLAAGLAAVALLGGILYLRPAVDAPLAPVRALKYRNAEWNDLVRTARAGGRFDEPAALRALTTSPDIVRGHQNAGIRGTFQPSGTVVESPQPRFSWPPAAGARYVVTIGTSRGEVAHSDVISEPQWTPPAPLLRGVTYMWQVEVRDASGSQVIPAPPHAELLFTILDEGRAGEIERARREYPADHLLAGLLYARAGVKERARDELEAWDAKHPDDTVARRLLAELEQW
jgi:Putative zinc-finger